MAGDGLANGKFGILDNVVIETDRSFDGEEFAGFIQRDFARAQDLLRIANFQPE